MISHLEESALDVMESHHNRVHLYQLLSSYLVLMVQEEVAHCYCLMAKHQTPNYTIRMVFFRHESLLLRKESILQLQLPIKATK